MRENTNDEATKELPAVDEERLQADKEKKLKKKKKKTQYLPWAIILTILAILTTIAFVFEMFYVTKYATLSASIFTKINLIALVVLLVIDILVFIAIRLRNKWVLGFMTMVLIAAGAIGGYAGYALTRVQTNINEITATERTTEVTASIVIYNLRSGTPILSTDNLEGMKVGIATSTDPATIAQENFAASGLNVEYMEYNSYADVFRALVNQEIDAAALPKRYAAVIGTDQDLAVYLNDVSLLQTYSKDMTSVAAESSDKDLTKEPFTVLITGENEGLADTIILVSVNPVSMDVTMSSIARDSYVPITCYNNGSSKINAAHAVSESCMVATVEQLMGVKVDYTVEFNFASVIQVVDAVGGLDIYSPVSFTAQCWDLTIDDLVQLPIEEGYQHLTGQLALGWVRERYAFADGDFARQQHQQEAIEQIVTKVMATRNPNTYLQILDAAGDNIKTNLTEQQMINFVSYAMNKAKRYYNGDSPVGVFNIQSSRVTGYNSTIYDSSLDMDLYIYVPYDGAISDTANRINRNTNLYAYAEPVGGVTWNAWEAYQPAAITSDYYYQNSYVGSTRSDFVQDEPANEEDTPVEPQETADPYAQDPQYTEVPGENPTGEEIPAENGGGEAPVENGGGESVDTGNGEDVSNEGE